MALQIYENNFQPEERSEHVPVWNKTHTLNSPMISSDNLPGWHFLLFESTIKHMDNKRALLGLLSSPNMSLELIMRLLRGLHWSSSPRDTAWQTCSTEKRDPQDPRIILTYEWELPGILPQLLQLTSSIWAQYRLNYLPCLTTGWNGSKLSTLEDWSKWNRGIPNAAATSVDTSAIGVIETKCLLHD